METPLSIVALDMTLNALLEIQLAAQQIQDKATLTAYTCGTQELCSQLATAQQSTRTFFAVILRV